MTKSSSALCGEPIASAVLNWVTDSKHIVGRSTTPCVAGEGRRLTGFSGVTTEAPSGRRARLSEKLNRSDSEHRDSVCCSSRTTFSHNGQGMNSERGRSARTHRSENPVEHGIKVLCDVLGEITQ